MKAKASRQLRLISRQVATAAFLLAGVGLAQEEVVSPLDKLLPRAPMVSSDGAFEVFAPPPRAGFRWPVLQFADRFTDEFFRVARLARGRIAHPIIIRMGSDTNELRVHSGTVPGLVVGEREWIEIPDPEHADLDELRLALLRALIRDWLRGQMPAAARRQLPLPPAWLLTGLVRQIGGGHRIEDLDLVHVQWLRGQQPTLTEIFSAGEEIPVTARQPAMLAVLSAWLLQQPEESFGPLLQRLAAGASWSPALLAAVLHKRTVAELEEDWDAWQASALREIRQPGLTTPALVSAFCAQLPFYPGDWGLPLPDGWRGRAPAECLNWPATPEVQAALRGKAATIRLFAVGRDVSLQRVAMAYGNFFDALAAGEERDRLRAMLSQAAEACCQLEGRAAKGEMLYNPASQTEPPATGRPRSRHAVP